MKQFHLFSLALFIWGIQTLVAQPTQPNTPPACNSANCTTTIGGNPWDQCINGNVSFVSNFQGGLLSSGTALTAGAVYRFKNVGTVGAQQINATVTINNIFNAVLSNIDDDASVDPSVIPQLFAPRIGTNAASLTTTDLRGYVQFTITFYQEVAPLNTGFVGAVNSATNNADFTTTINLSNLKFIHYDNDGNNAGVGTGSTAWFRETGVVLRTAPGSVSVFGGSPTELSAYSYTDGGNFFTGFAGSVCERSNVSSCIQVAEFYIFNIATNSITFRLGYDYKGAPGASGTIAARQFGTRFNCVNLPTQGPLPVNVFNFGVNYKDGQATLKWTASNEQGFDRYEIQRSVNGTDFTAVATVNAAGVSFSSINYEHVDDVKAVNGNVVFYRLRLIEADGKFSYSHTVSLRKGSISGKINISPNPASSSVVIRFKAEQSGIADLIIADVAGRIVLQRKAQFQGGDNNISVPEINALTDGIYTVKIVYGNETVQERLVKRK